MKLIWLNRSVFQRVEYIYLKDKIISSYAVKGTSCYSFAKKKKEISIFATMQKESTLCLTKQRIWADKLLQVMKWHTEYFMCPTAGCKTKNSVAHNKLVTRSYLHSYAATVRVYMI